MVGARHWSRSWLLLCLLLSHRALTGDGSALLHLLGVDLALSGMPAVLELAATGTGVDLAAWSVSPAGRDLGRRLAPEALAAHLEAALESGLESGERRQLASLLDDSLVRRVRQRQGAAVGPGEFDEIQAYREQMRARPPLAMRRELMRDIALYGRGAELSALLQGLAELALDGSMAREDLPARTAARTHSMLPLLEDYYLYAFRHLRNRELRRYLTLLQSEPVQRALELIVRVLEDYPEDWPPVAAPG